MRRLSLAVLTFIVTEVMVSAQKPPQSVDGPGPLRFEVAAVKRNTSPDLIALRFPPGRLIATSFPLQSLITFAYGVRADQVVNIPRPIDSERFDISAKAFDDARPDQMMLMMRALLVERFKLVMHTETRDAPVYALVRTREQSPLGPRITRSTMDCEAIRAERVAIPLPSARMLDDAASLTTALSDQLGLKLISVRAPIDHLVIDKVEMPMTINSLGSRQRLVA